MVFLKTNVKYHNFAVQVETIPVGELLSLQASKHLKNLSLHSFKSLSSYVPKVAKLWSLRGRQVTRSANSYMGKETISQKQ